MEEKEDKKDVSISPRLKLLAVGDTLVYPIENMLSVRTVCSTIGLHINAKFKTKIDRESKTITVKRIS